MCTCSGLPEDSILEEKGEFWIIKTALKKKLPKAL